jgi:hypothetical protein
MCACVSGVRETLLSTVRSRLDEAMSSFFAERRYHVSGPLDNGPCGLDGMNWQPGLPYKQMRPVCSFEYDRYEPETEHYGGRRDCW